MTTTVDEPAVEAANEIAIAFANTAPTIWRSTATCPHGWRTTSTKFADAAPLDHAGMVQRIWADHDLHVRCLICTRTAPIQNATLSVQLPLTLQPDERRVLYQTTATVTGGNFVFGPLTCQKSGAYHIEGQMQLASSVAQGARGTLSVVIGGLTTYGFGLSDVGGKATATIWGLVNIHRNESVMLVFHNLSSSSQTLQSVSFKIGAVWVP